MAKITGYDSSILTQLEELKSQSGIYIPNEILHVMLVIKQMSL